jgi:hypothetical protein
MPEFLLKQPVHGDFKEAGSPTCDLDCLHGFNGVEVKFLSPYAFWLKTNFLIVALECLATNDFFSCESPSYAPSTLPVKQCPRPSAARYDGCALMRSGSIRARYKTWRGCTVLTQRAFEDYKSPRAW